MSRIPVPAHNRDARPHSPSPQVTFPTTPEREIRERERATSPLGRHSTISTSSFSRSDSHNIQSLTGTMSSVSGFQTVSETRRKQGKRDEVRIVYAMCWGWVRTDVRSVFLFRQSERRSSRSSLASVLSRPHTVSNGPLNAAESPALPRAL